MDIIECKDLTLANEGKQVLQGLNITVSKGDILCVVGENGTGKSTFIRALLRLQKPVSGSVALLNGLKPTDIGYLPQQTDGRHDFPASVREIVLSGCLNSLGFFPFYGKKEKALADEIMELLGITDLKKRSFGELSGGQQQRVLIARAFCSAKKVLVLDEPDSGLDPMITAETYEIIKHLNVSKGLTVIMATHDLAAVKKYATRVLHLSGLGSFSASKEEYLSSPIGTAFMKNGGSK